MGKSVGVTCQAWIVRVYHGQQIAGWTGVVPAQSHKLNDEGSNPSPATLEGAVHGYKLVLNARGTSSAGFDSFTFHSVIPYT